MSGIYFFKLFSFLFNKDHTKFGFYKTDFIVGTGALTSKPFAFKARAWELDSHYIINIIDSGAQKIRLDTKNLEIMGILPWLDYPNSENWISDRVRFSYDGFDLNGITKIFVKTKFIIIPLILQLFILTDPLFLKYFSCFFFKSMKKKKMFFTKKEDFLYYFYEFFLNLNDWITLTNNYAFFFSKNFNFKNSNLNVNFVIKNFNFGLQLKKVIFYINTLLNNSASKQFLFLFKNYLNKYIYTGKLLLNGFFTGFIPISNKGLFYLFINNIFNYSSIKNFYLISDLSDDLLSFYFFSKLTYSNGIKNYNNKFYLTKDLKINFYEGISFINGLTLQYNNYFGNFKKISNVNILLILDITLGFVNSSLALHILKLNKINNLTIICWGNFDNFPNSLTKFRLSSNFSQIKALFEFGLWLSCFLLTTSSVVSLIDENLIFSSKIRKYVFIFKNYYKANISYFLLKKNMYINSKFFQNLIFFFLSKNNGLPYNFLQYSKKIFSLKKIKFTIYNTNLNNVGYNILFSSNCLLYPYFNKFDTVKVIYNNNYKIISDSNFVPLLDEKLFDIIIPKLNLLEKFSLYINNEGLFAKSLFIKKGFKFSGSLVTTLNLIYITLLFPKFYIIDNFIYKNFFFKTLYTFLWLYGFIKNLTAISRFKKIKKISKTNVFFIYGNMIYINQKNLSINKFSNYINIGIFSTWFSSSTYFLSSGYTTLKYKLSISIEKTFNI